jgi:potassium/chloride transporter 4/5/6
VATLVSSLANYSATVQAPTDPDAPDKAKSSPKLGTLAGVYFPCMQNIFGVILFIRLTWIIGTAGIVQGFCLVTMCCTCVSDPPCQKKNPGQKISITTRASPLQP